MEAQSLQQMARMTEQSGGSYAEYSRRTDFGGSVITRHKDILKTYVKELGNPGVSDDNVSQKLDEAPQTAESRDDLTRPETNSISKVPQLPPVESMPKSSGDELRGANAYNGPSKNFLKCRRVTEGSSRHLC